MESDVINPRLILKGYTMQQYYDYLDALRLSGVTNMFGAAPYLQREFNLGRQEAKDILLQWMSSK
jgi:hypothetical protein